MSVDTQILNRMSYIWTSNINFGRVSPCRIALVKKHIRLRHTGVSDPSSDFSIPVETEKNDMNDKKKEKKRESERKNDDGGGFLLACEDFGIMFDNSFTVCAYSSSSSSSFFFFFKVEISSRTLIPLFKPGSVHSASAS